jgi:hypothetical protein
MICPLDTTLSSRAVASRCGQGLLRPTCDLSRLPGIVSERQTLALAVTCTPPLSSTPSPSNTDEPLSP